APAEAVAEPAPAETATAEAPPAAETPAEPALVEVWRPGGRHEERRPRSERNRHRHQRDQRKADSAPAQAGDAVAAQPAGRGDKAGRGGRESGPALRQYATSANPRDNRTADPNSPSAKLAALKEQLARKD